MNKLVYSFIASLDLVLLGLFYGPAFVGGSFRSLPGFDDYFPILAFVMLCVSTISLLPFVSGQFRNMVRESKLMMFCSASILIYFVISVVAFGSLITEGI